MQQWFRTFAAKPVGTAQWGLLWVATIAGFAYGSSRHGALGVAFATVPVSALALGVLQILPPFERLGLWAVPALYVGLALCADAGLCLVRRRQTRLTTLAGVVAGAGIVVFGIIESGESEIGARRADENYGLDDRSATRRLQGLRQSGDPVLTTHFGLVGLWWYGGVDIAGSKGGAYLHDSPVFEIFHEPEPAECDRYESQWDALVRRTGRVVVYVGFRMNVEPPGFDKLVLDQLAGRAAVVGWRRYADLSHVATFDFTQAPQGESNHYFERTSVQAPPPLGGCVGVRPAKRW